MSVDPGEPTSAGDQNNRETPDVIHNGRPASSEPTDSDRPDRAERRGGGALRKEHAREGDSGLADIGGLPLHTHFSNIFFKFKFSTAVLHLYHTYNVRV